MTDVVAQPDAPLGRNDPTRRWGVRRADGSADFPGVTPEEADRHGARLASLTDAARAVALVPVTLPVVVSDGAGPYLLAGDGTLMLALGPHPAMPAVAVAMGTPRPGRRRVAAVREAGDGLWSAVAQADVAEADAVGALDALVALTDAAGCDVWATRWGAMHANVIANP